MVSSERSTRDGPSMFSIPATTAIFTLCVFVVSGQEVYFGQSASFSGGVWEYGVPYREGILSAMNEVNLRGGVHGRMLRLVSVDDQYIASNIPANMDRLMALQPALLAFVGFTGSAPSVAAAPIASSLRIPLIGPYTGTPDIRSATSVNRYVINLRAGYRDEAFAMLKLFVESKHFKRVCMIYQNDSFGIPAMEAVTAAMANMRLTLTGTHAYNKAETASFDFAMLAEQVLAESAQGIIFFGVDTFSNPFLRAFKQLYDAAAATSSSATPFPQFITSSFIGDGLRSSATVQSISAPSFHQTQVVPHPLSSTSAIATRYRAALSTYRGTSSASMFNYVSLEGYVLGRFLIEVLNRTQTISPFGFLDAIYQTKMFDLDELMLGPFSGSCRGDEDSSVMTRSSLCSCNQGLRSVTTTLIEPSTNQFVEEQTLSYSFAHCMSTINEVQRPIILHAIARDGLASAREAVRMLEEILTNVSSAPLYISRYYTSATTNATEDELTRVGTQTPLLGALGLAPIAAQTVYPVFPLSAQPVEAARPFQRATFHLLSTLQQEMFVNAKHLAHVLNTSQLYLVSRAHPQSEAIHTLVSHSLVTFGRALNGHYTFDDSLSLSKILQILPPSATFVLIGIQNETEMAAVVESMTERALLTGYFPFSDVALYWELLSAHSSCETLPSRVLFSTSLPHWMNPSSSWVAAYHAATSPAARLNPFYAVGYLLARFIDFVQSRAANADAFIDTVYRNSVVSIDDLTLGPFVDTQCSDSDCLCNVGPRTVTTYRIASFFPPMSDGEASVHFSGCHVTYALPTKSGVSTALIASLAVCIPVLLLIGAFVFYWLRPKGRDHTYAPCDPSSPFACVFTDIESSTALWGRYPSIMAKAIDSHHAIIRTAISKHHMYEVKTIGDSFMCVSKSPDDALKFALEVQMQLFQHDWDTRSIDELYAATHATKRNSAVPTQGSRRKSLHTPQMLPQENPEVLPHSPQCNNLSFPASNYVASVCGDDPERCWNGLRVRIGVNFGRGEIRFDETAGSYDYYGSVVNEAARIEAVGHGGQIVAPAEYLATATGVETSEYKVTQLGVQSLRGVDRHVTLVQILPVALSSRTFPPLRLDILPKETASISSSKHETSVRGSQDSSYCGLEEAATDLANKHSLVTSGAVDAGYMKNELLRFKGVLEGLFSPVPAEFRRTTVKGLFETWRVHGAGRSSTGAEIGFLRLASRVAETSFVISTFQTLPVPDEYGESSTWMGHSDRPETTIPLPPPDSPRAAT